MRKGVPWEHECFTLAAPDPSTLATNLHDLAVAKTVARRQHLIPDHRQGPGGIPQNTGQGRLSLLLSGRAAAEGEGIAQFLRNRNTTEAQKRHRNTEDPTPSPISLCASVDILYHLWCQVPIR